MGIPKLSIFEVDQENNISKHPILLIDKTGVLGALLSQGLRRNAPEITTILVTEELPLFTTVSEKAIAISFQQPIPRIPNARYSYIFIVYNGEKEVLDILPECLEKAKIDRAYIVFLCDRTVATQKLLEHIPYSYRKSTVFVFGDLFGQNIPLDVSRSIGRLLYGAIYKGKIQVEQEGLEKTFPVFIDDVISQVLTTVLEGKISTKPLLLMPKHAPSELGLAHMIQKAEPFVTIDFIKQRTKQVNEDVDGEYVLGQRYPLEKRIKKWVETLKIEEGIASLKQVKEEKKKEKIPVKKIKQTRMATLRAGVFLFILFILLLPVITTISATILGLGLLSYTKTATEEGKFVNAKNAAFSSSIMFSLAKQSAIVTSREFAWTRRNDFDSFIVDVGYVQTLSQSVSDILSAVATISTSPKQNTREVFVKGTQTIKRAVATIQTIEAEQANNESSGVSQKSWLSKTLHVEKLYSPEIKSAVALVSTFSDVSPTLLGMNGRKIYLVLFQNNMELRPGGGFIGSYGLLSLQNGTVDSFSIHDVYDADGKLKGHIEPPFAIRRYLPSVHWYLRDSNFAVDFRKNASSAAFMLSEETGQTVDGVIGVDVSFLQLLLQAVGPVYVPEYNETVDAKTLYQKVQTHAEKDFFPGSTQKKDYLRALASALEQKLSSEKHIPYVSLLSSVMSAISQKHVLFVASDENIENVFAVNGLSSSLWDSRETSDSQLNDFNGVIDANIGINKVNRAVTRKFFQDMQIKDDGTLEGKTSVEYKNNGGAGDYKNYVRVVLPAHSVLTGITIDDQEQPFTPAITDPALYESKSFKAPKGIEVEQSTEEGKSLIGLLLQIPSGETKKVTVSYYAAQQSIDPNGLSFSYFLKLFKQPGTDADPYTLTLLYPSSYKVLLSSTSIQNIQNTIVYKTTLTKDKDLVIRFAKR